MSRLSQQRIGLTEQGAAIRNLQSGVSQTGPQTSIAPTGTGATFMSHADYFNTQGGKGKAARRTADSTVQSKQRSWTLPSAAHGGSGSSSGL